MTMLTLLAPQWGVRLRGKMLRLVLWVLAGLLALSVAGCAVGPDFEAPGTPAVSRYTSPGKAGPAKHTTDRGEPAVQSIAVGEKISAEWWKLFQSRELNRVVKDAIADSPTLESAEAKLAQAHEG